MQVNTSKIISCPWGQFIIFTCEMHIQLRLDYITWRFLYLSRQNVNWIHRRQKTWRNVERICIRSVHVCVSHIAVVSPPTVFPHNVYAWHESTFLCYWAALWKGEIHLAHFCFDFLFNTGHRTAANSSKNIPGAVTQRHNQRNSSVLL